MNIIIGDYRITSDSHNIILERKTIGKEGSKSEGKIVWQTEGYFPNLEYACNSLLNRKIRASEAQSIGELKQLLIECTGAICAAVKGGCTDGDISNRPRE